MIEAVGVVSGPDSTTLRISGPGVYPSQYQVMYSGETIVRTSEGI